jgi:hypothetical protein
MPTVEEQAQPKENDMSITTPRADWLGRSGALCGSASAALTFVAYLVIGPNPESAASTATLTRYYSAHHADVSLAGTLLMYAAILFACFGVTAWSRIRATDLHPVFAAAILIATALAAVSDLADASGWYMLGGLGGKATISGATIQGLHLSVAAPDMPAAAGIGIFLVAFAAAGVVGGIFSRWLSWSALALGVLELIPTPEQLGFVAGLATLPWMIAAGVGMYRSARRDSAASYPAASALVDPL